MTMMREWKDRKFTTLRDKRVRERKKERMRERWRETEEKSKGRQMCIGKEREMILCRIDLPICQAEIYASSLLQTRS